MLAAFGGQPALWGAFRAGACGLVASGTLARLFSAAAAEARAYPKPDTEHFQYSVLQAPLMEGDDLHGVQQLPRHLLPYAARLGALGGQRAPSDGEQAYQAALTAAREAQPFALLVGTGGTEDKVLSLSGKYHREFCKNQQVLAGELPRELLACGAGPTVPPVLLLAHPSANSLPSALEALARLQQDGFRGRIIYLPSAAQGKADEAWGTLKTALKHVRVWHQLHRCCIGMVGKPSSWLVASTPSSQTVSESWGPSLVDVDMEELLGGLWGTGHFKKGEVDAVVRDMLEGGQAAAHSAGDEAGCPSCGATAVDAEPAAKVYLAMRQLVDSHQLSVVSVRCFDVVTAKQTTGCYSLARLLDENVIAGCEGDVCSALGMLWGKLMTGQVPWMANVAQVDPADGTLTLAHCTIARSLLTLHETTTHFESGLGVAFKGRVPPGSVTLLRIGGKNADQLWVEEGYALRDDQPGREWSPSLCRTQVAVSLLGGRAAVEQLLLRPLGNHVVMLRGHHKAELEAYFTQFGPGAPK